MFSGPFLWPPSGPSPAFFVKYGSHISRRNFKYRNLSPAPWRLRWQGVASPPPSYPDEQRTQRYFPPHRCCSMCSMLLFPHFIPMAHRTHCSPPFPLHSIGRHSLPLHFLVAYKLTSGGLPRRRYYMAASKGSWWVWSSPLPVVHLSELIGRLTTEIQNFLRISIDTSNKLCKSYEGATLGCLKC